MTFDIAQLHGCAMVCHSSASGLAVAAAFTIDRENGVARCMVNPSK
jgi:hypothetical protein